jgi:hypothetical protein
MAVINLRMSSVLLKMVGAERPRAKDFHTINIDHYRHFTIACLLLDQGLI